MGLPSTNEDIFNKYIENQYLKDQAVTEPYRRELERAYALKVQEDMERDRRWARARELEAGLALASGVWLRRRNALALEVANWRGVRDER